MDADDKKKQIANALNQAPSGRRQSLDAMLPMVYDELRKIANAQMGDERKDHTLQATVLVHEAYVKLAQQRNIDFSNRSQFFAAASTIIRRILVDHARTKGRAKRGGKRDRVDLQVAEGIAGKSQIDLVGLNDALEQLAVYSERGAKVVEMRFFGGLTMEEIAGVLEVSLSTVNNDWTFARAWLARELARGQTKADADADSDAG